jgi:chromosome segregation protein
MTSQARLLSVRLQGFKSFADRTHVEFGPGISAVVGPNGSGKSNLADALRWALGEQGRALRTRKSEDVVWAGSEKRPAVGMADVQLTLDNGDGLLPVDYGVVELGRRLYRSGENDYLLNRSRVRLKDLIDLLDAGHLAENAFLFIGQGMVDQALALRPEERRPLFEDVAGVRRHERRRRRAEEQLTESEANLARVEDILAELRPQARRLGQQAEQQASRRSAADELAAAILASAHARWHAAGRRASDAASVLAARRAALDAAMGELLEQEQVAAAVAAALDGRAAAEAAARASFDRARDERAALQLREGRHASDAASAERERASLEAVRAAASRELDAARQALAAPLAPLPEELEAELASHDAEIAATDAGGPANAGPSSADLAAIRRLEAARAQEVAAARRRAAEAERAAGEEAARAATAAGRVQEVTAEQAQATQAREAALVEEASARTGREAAQAAVANAEAAARSAADNAGGARAAAAAAAARHEDARRALESADGGSFSRAARARGGRSIGDGLIVDTQLTRAVDAALAGLGRAHVVARAEIEALASDRGVAIAAEALEPAVGEGEPPIVIEARARGGGLLAGAIRRDDSKAVTRLLARTVWLPDAAAAIALQPLLPAGWMAVARDGSVLVGEIATWTRPEGRGLHLRDDAERLASASAAAAEAAEAAATALRAAEQDVATARSALAAAREQEAQAQVARRRAEEVERVASGRLDAASRESAWLSAQAARLAAEAQRLRAALPPDEPRPSTAEPADPAASAATNASEAKRREQLAALQARRRMLAEEVRAARAARADSERRHAQATAAAELAERQLAYAATTAAELVDREARLATERDAIVAALADAELAVTRAEATLGDVVRAAADDRERLRAAETAVLAIRERVRIAQEAGRASEREELEARLALDALRESVLVELAGLGNVGLRHLGHEGGASTGDGEPGGDVLEAAVATAARAWERDDPPADPPTPSRLASLRRRFHDLGAVNPFAADEYAEVKTRLDTLEAQRTDLVGAIEKTRTLIAELDQLVSDQFRRTFAALEKAFDRRFQQLFGGGFAHLALTDPQDLTNTGIEITARPPGKKPQALAMLSGGERALTAVALLFSMLEVRPVPFCVLDEVDAALDEANIGRFTDALKELSQSTQCIVITHNRGTIEAADAMYGVTVGDDSVSRVISLRLDEATALAERARNATPGTTARPAPVAVAIDGGTA